MKRNKVEHRLLSIDESYPSSINTAKQVACTLGDDQEKRGRGSIVYLFHNNTFADFERQCTNHMFWVTDEDTFLPPEIIKIIMEFRTEASMRCLFQPMHALKNVTTPAFPVFACDFCTCLWPMHQRQMKHPEFIRQTEPGLPSYCPVCFVLHVGSQVDGELIDKDCLLFGTIVARDPPRADSDQLSLYISTPDPVSGDHAYIPGLYELIRLYHMMVRYVNICDLRNTDFGFPETLKALKSTCKCSDCLTINTLAGWTADKYFLLDNMAHHFSWAEWVRCKRHLNKGWRAFCRELVKRFPTVGKMEQQFLPEIDWQLETMDKSLKLQAIQPNDKQARRLLEKLSREKHKGSRLVTFRGTDLDNLVQLDISGLPVFGPARLTLPLNSKYRFPLADGYGFVGPWTFNSAIIHMSPVEEVMRRSISERTPFQDALLLIYDKMRPGYFKGPTLLDKPTFMFSA